MYAIIFVLLLFVKEFCFHVTNDDLLDVKAECLSEYKKMFEKCTHENQCKFREIQTRATILYDRVTRRQGGLELSTCLGGNEQRKCIKEKSKGIGAKHKKLKKLSSKLMISHTNLINQNITFAQFTEELEKFVAEKCDYILNIGILLNNCSEHINGTLSNYNCVAQHFLFKRSTFLRSENSMDLHETIVKDPRNIVPEKFVTMAETLPLKFGNINEIHSKSGIIHNNSIDEDDSNYNSYLRKKSMQRNNNFRQRRKN